MNKKAKHSGRSRAPKKTKKVARKPAKRRINLLLDSDSVASALRYGKSHGTSLSQLVNGFLRELLERTDKEPDASFIAELSTPVRRLFGVAARETADSESHREYLLEKYGSRR